MDTKGIIGLSLTYIHIYIHHYNSIQLFFQFQSDRFLISNPIVFVFLIRQISKFQPDRFSVSNPIVFAASFPYSK